MRNKAKSYSAFSVVIVFILLLCIGALLIPKLSIRLLPSQSYASLTLTSSIWGASTEVTELELTSPLEAALARMQGVTHISSLSENGRCQIKVELDKWTDPQLFRFEVSTLLRQLFPKLPQGASYPQIYLNQPADDKQNQPLLTFSISGNTNANELIEYANEEFKALFSEVKGIYDIVVVGGQSIYEGIVPEPDKMKVLGLNITDLQEQLEDGFRSKELGSLRSLYTSNVLFLSKSINDKESLVDFPILAPTGRIFKLKDIARISERKIQPNSLFRINGNEQVTVLFYPEENINTIDLARQIKQKLGTAEALSAGYFVQLQFDQTEYIKAELDKIYIRTALSVSILLMFVIGITRNFRYVLIVLLSLSANVLLSIICYYFFRLDIHLYSLAGITISMGLVIDNVIVIVEDIRHTGRNRIFAAILAATLTALGALSVIFLLEESQKIQLIDFAVAVIINLLISLPIAYFFIPALLELLPVRARTVRYLYARKRLIVLLNKIYERQLKAMLYYKKSLLILFILSFGLPIYLLPPKLDENLHLGHILYNHTFGSQFYTENLREPLSKLLGGVLYYYIRHASSFRNLAQESEQETQLLIQITMPVGAQIAQMDAVCRSFEALLNHYSDEIRLYTTDIYNSSSATIRIFFPKEVHYSQLYRIKSELERKSILSGSADFSITGVGQGFNNALNIDMYESAIAIKGYNYQQLQSLAMLIRDSLLRYKRVSDILISSVRERQKKSVFEHVIRLKNPEYLALNNIGPRSLSQSLNKLALRNPAVGVIENKAGKMDITVLLSYNYENEPTIWTTQHESLQVNDSSAIKLATIANISKLRIDNKMAREDQAYVLYVNYRVIGSFELQRLISERLIKSIRDLLPLGYSVIDMRFGNWKDSALNYLWFVPIVLLIIYLICCILLESFKQGILVVAMIPFSFIGVFLTFHILGLPFDQGGYTALLMLSGLVTNAALYMLNDLNFLVSKRISPLKRFVKALNRKVMPIFITIAAAILSLLPFMLSGEEKGFWFTLSAGTIGGLLFSLLGALVLLPLLLIPQIPKSKRHD